MKLKARLTHAERRAAKAEASLERARKTIKKLRRDLDDALDANDAFEKENLDACKVIVRLAQHFLGPEANREEVHALAKKWYEENSKRTEKEQRALLDRWLQQINFRDD